MVIYTLASGWEAETGKGKAEKSSAATRAALIGLVGVLLTACGGLAGALLTAGVTIYQGEREAQQVALPAPGGDQAMTVDTHQIEIAHDEALLLATDDYLVDADLGNVLIDGHETNLSTERWALFEGPQHYYALELNYVPAPGQSLQVRGGLQTYLDAFRIIR